MTRTVLTVLGSGTLLPDHRRHSASYHIEHEGHSIILDCGTGTVHGLSRHGIDWTALDAVAITHYHTDHVGDLAALISAFRFTERTRPLHLIGPPGFADFLDRLAAAFGPWIVDPGFDVVVRELGEGVVWGRDLVGFDLQACSTPHTEESIALRLGVTGAVGAASQAVIGYTGDTGPSDDVARHLSGCRLLVSECGLDDPPEMDRHLSPTGVAGLAAVARPELLVLTHVYPPQKPEEACRAVSRRYPGRVIAAVDGLRVEIDAEGAVYRAPVDPPAHPV